MKGISDRDEANNGANQGQNEANNERRDYYDSARSEKIENAVVESIINKPQITQNELAELLNVSRSTIQRVTKALSEKGILERVGGTRGYWNVDR